MICVKTEQITERKAPLLIYTSQKTEILHGNEKSLPLRQAFRGKDQMTCCSSHLPRTKRTKKQSERKAQSRYMPIQMDSSPP